MPFTVYVIKLTATNIANGFEEDSTRECFLANGLNIEDSRMFSVAPISRYMVLQAMVSQSLVYYDLYSYGDPINGIVFDN